MKIVLKILLQKTILFLHRSEFVIKSKIFKHFLRIEKYKLDKYFLYEWQVLSSSVVMNVNLDSYIESKLYFNTNYGLNVLEPLDFNLCRALKKKITKPVLIDVGANVGTMCLPIAKKFTLIDVIAYEPNPDIFKRLKQNIQLNSVDNIDARMCGVSEQSGRLVLNVPTSSSANFGSSSYLNNIDIDNPKKIQTKVVSLDEDIGDNHHVVGIKIDVQGLELDVLKGALSLIKEYKPFLIFEIEDIYYEDPYSYQREVRDFFQNLNYNLYKIDRFNSKIYHFYEDDIPTSNDNIIALPKP